MTFTPPPEPSHGVHDVPAGHVITRDHPAWHRRDDESVWGTLAGVHNPFHDDMQDTGPYWGNGATHAFWEKARQDHPERYEAALHSARRALSGAHPAIAISTHALHRVLDDGHVRSAFTSGTTGGTFGDVAPYLELRRMNEYAHFRYPDDHPGHARPVYGYLTHDPAEEGHASGYGQHTLVLSRPALAHRTTWTSDDSLNHENYVRATPVTEPGLRSFDRPRSSEHDYGVHESITDHTRRNSFIEAQVHGGVGLHHVHYAVLRTAHGEPDHHADELAARLAAHGIASRHVREFDLPQEIRMWKTEAAR